MTRAGKEFDLKLTSGRLHAQRFGPADGPLVIAVHGLSANMHCFDVLGKRLAGRGLQVVAVDLRGRGRSDVTPRGTYGVRSHAHDVLEVGRALEEERFAIVGWSLGALIGMQAAEMQADRVSHLVLIDHAGRADPGAVETLRRGLDRLDVVTPSEEDYLTPIRAAGLAAPWDEHWDRFYRYELRPDKDGFRPRTSKAAALEDLASAFMLDARSLWRAIRMPALLVRAMVPLPGGLIVPDRAAEALRSAVPHLHTVEIERNHFGVVMHRGAAAKIGDFLTA